MKKLIAILVVFAVVTGAAFAQVNVGMWGTLSFSPLQLQTPELKGGEKVKDIDGNVLGARTSVGVGPFWIWGNEIGGEVNISAGAESIGFQICLEPVGDGIWGGVWAKPFNGSDAFVINVGNINNQTLEGKIGPGGSNIGAWVNPKFSGDPHFIFTRIGTSGGEVHTKYGNTRQGFMFSSTPVDGLFLAWSIATTDRIGNQGSGMRANDAFRNSIAAIGYNIDGIGLVRAGYLGGWAGKLDLSDPKSKAYKKWDRAAYKPSVDLDTGKVGVGDNEQASIEVAFNLTALENVKFDIGYRGWIPITLWDNFGTSTAIKAEKVVKTSNGHQVAAGVDMTFGIFNLRIWGRGNFGSYSSRIVNPDALDSAPFAKDKKRNGLVLNAKLDPSLSLDFGTIGLSIAYHGEFSPTVPLTDSDGDFTKFGKNKDSRDFSHTIGMGLWYERGLGNGNIVIGLTFTMAALEPKDGDDGKYSKPAFNGSHYFQVPITLTYWF